MLTYAQACKGKKTKYHCMKTCLNLEAALHWCSLEKVFGKYAANLQENTMPTLLKSPHVNLLHIFRTHFPRNTSGGLLLSIKLSPGNFAP